MKDSDDPQQTIKSLKGEIEILMKDIERKLYFDSVVTDHTKLESIK